MANRNRQAGHDFERAVVKELKDIGYGYVVTSRSESRNMDNLGVDIFDRKNELPVYIQCKNSASSVQYAKLLNSNLLPKDKATVIFHKKTHKVNKIFVSDGEFVIMDKEFFYELLKIYKENRNDKK